MPIIATPEMVEKIARRMCVKDGKDPDQLLSPGSFSPSYRDTERFKPYPRWKRYAVKVKSSLDVFECLFEIIEEEKGNGRG